LSVRILGRFILKVRRVEVVIFVDLEVGHGRLNNSKKSYFLKSRLKPKTI
jgi:hypothetical protein